ncbi:MAG TPA: signal peptidase I [Planctomycetota bacterium]|nr:signal peptidase I [Planctomycetota bacterium]
MTELIFRYLKIGIAFTLAWVLLYFWTSCSYREIKGKEMAPGLAPGKNYWVLIKERTPDVLNPDDVIAFEYASPGVGDKESVRAGRVSAMPGQRVKMVKGDLYINGRKTGTAVGKPDEGFDEIIVPRDCYFILMDNREVGPTLDSRANGPLGIGAVLGRVKK